MKMGSQNILIIHVHPSLLQEIPLIVLSREKCLRLGDPDDGVDG